MTLPIKDSEANGAPSKRSASRGILIADRWTARSNGSDMFHVYILRCADGSTYVGSTQDLAGREDAHNAGRGAAYTFHRRPVRFVHFERFGTLEEAVQRERQIKRWSRAKKEALIAGKPELLRNLSRSRGSKSLI